MPRPVLVKLGGSVITDKEREMTFRRTVARRLLGEVAKANVPAVIVHGAGSYGHPMAARHQLGSAPVTSKARAGVAETLAAVAELQAHVSRAALEAGLLPVAVPLHLCARREGDQVLDIPIADLQALLDDGFTPILSGTLVRDSQLGWGILGGDEVLQEMAHELEPRLAVFVTDVDGVYDRDPQSHPDARLQERLDAAGAAAAGSSGGKGADVTGRMAGKMAHAAAVAHTCPVLVVNGTVRGRLLDTLRGKQVVGTRIVA